MSHLDIERKGLPVFGISKMHVGERKLKAVQKLFRSCMSITQGQWLSRGLEFDERFFFSLSLSLGPELLIQEALTTPHFISSWRLRDDMTLLVSSSDLTHAR